MIKPVRKLCVLLPLLGGWSLLSCSPQNEYTGIGVNHPPSAVDDEFQITSGEFLPLDVLKNDADEDGDALNIVAISALDGHTIEIKNNKIRYIPKSLNYTGVVRFSYVVSDSQTTAEALVTVYITNRD